MPPETGRRRRPRVLTLAAGEYYWCGCGRATDNLCPHQQPAPHCQRLHFSLSRRETVWLCPCGKTTTAPWCDGHSHNTG